MLKVFCAVLKTAPFSVNISRAGAGQRGEQSVTDSRLASLVITHTDNAHNTLTLPSLLSVTTAEIGLESMRIQNYRAYSVQYKLLNHPCERAI